MSHCNPSLAVPGEVTPSVFSFAPGMDLRVIDREGSPWFLAADVCASLGLQNPAQVVGELDPRDKHIQSIGLKGRAPWVVSESGLYSLIFKSRKPEAQAFQRWVTSVVLPAIRKDGGYVAGEEKVATGEMGEDELMARALVMAQNKLTRLASEVRSLTQKVAEQAPAVEFHETYVASPQTQTLTEAAKVLRVGPRLLMTLLVGDRVLFRRSASSPLLPLQTQLKAGRFVVVPALNAQGQALSQTRVTTKGLDWLSKVYGGFASASTAAPRHRSL